MLFILGVCSFAGNTTQAQLAGFWLEDNGSLGLILDESGYATLIIDGDILFSGECEELADGSTGIMKYSVKYKEPYNDIDLEIQALPDYVVMQSYKGIFVMNTDGQMVLSCLFDNDAARPTEFEPSSTFILNYYDISEE